MTPPDLLPCPFCCALPSSLTVLKVGPTAACIQCTECNATGPTRVGVDPARSAADAWNLVFEGGHA